VASEPDFQQLRRGVALLACGESGQENEHLRAGPDPAIAFLQRSVATADRGEPFPTKGQTMTTTTAAKTPSAELAKLERKRAETYATLQQAKGQRQAWDDDLRLEQAALGAYIDQHPEDWRDDARNPKPGTESDKKRRAYLAKAEAGNPHEGDYAKAREEFHGHDEAFNQFLRRHLPDLIAEEESAFEAVVDKIREAFDLLIEAGIEHEALLARVQALVKATPGIDGQAITYDPRPREWMNLAERALDEPLARPGLTELGQWKLRDR
jgi:hypothetical protein